MTTFARTRPDFDTATRDLGKLFDKLPPHSIEAEMSLLGSLILAGTENVHMIGEVMQLIKSGDDFYLPKHAAIYETVVELYDRNASIDAIQLTQRLRDRQLLDSIGGVDYLVELAEAVPTAVNAPHYAVIIRDKSKLRSLINAAGRILREAHESSDPANIVLDLAEKYIFEIAQSKSDSEPSSLHELMSQTFELLEKRQESGRTISGLSTGFYQLDEMLSGLQKGELLIVAARPSMGKCLAADSEIVLGDGRVATIGEIFAAREAELLTLDDGMRLKMTRPSVYFDDGVKPVARVTTRSGRTIKTTWTHPFLTIDGWKKLAELKVGESVATPREIGVFGDRAMDEHRVKLLGYLLGDGGLTNANPRFTNSSALLRDDFAAAVEAFGGLKVRLEDSGGSRTATLCVSSDVDERGAARQDFGRRLGEAIRASGRSARSVAKQIGVSPASITHWCGGGSSPDAETLSHLCATLGVETQTIAPAGAAPLRQASSNALTAWLTELGLMGCGAHDKFIPACVFTLARAQLALLLNRLFATDGWASVLTSGQSQLGYCSASERLARQVQHLLLRFGIMARLKRRGIRYRGELRTAWQLDITDADSIRTFCTDVGIFGKEAAVERVLHAIDARRYQTNVDLIPKEVWRRIDEARGDESWASIAQRLGHGPRHNLHVGTRALSRDRLARFADVLGDAGLRRLAHSDVYWDPIVSIEPAGEEQVYDLTIPETHNFIANDICVHNTAFALNMATNVAVHNQQPVAVFSLEMGKQQLAERMLSSQARVDAQKMRRNMLSPDDVMRLQDAAAHLAGAPMFIDDTPGLSILELRAKARRLAAKHDIQLIMIDYMQLMSCPGTNSRQEEVGAISRGVKALARELNVPVICLSQLNRNPEGRESKVPMLSDLRESGSIEQDADVVMMLHREDYYHFDETWRQENPDKVGVAEIIIAKQRNGPTGAVPLQFDRATTTFHNLARGYEG